MSLQSPHPQQHPPTPQRTHRSTRRVKAIAAQRRRLAQLERKKAQRLRELALRHLRYFVRLFWSVADPKIKQIDWGPHLDIICDELQAFFAESDRRRAMPAEDAGELPPLRLVINVPPRSGKSTILQKLAVAWRWLHEPGDQILALANNPTLVERDGSALRRVVQSPQYRQLQRLLMAQRGESGEPWTLRKDQNAKKRFDTTMSGTRQGYPWDADWIGVDADFIFIDDPNDVKAILSGTPERVAERMKETVNTYEDKATDRLNSQVYGGIILIMQRLDENDLAAHMIKEGAAVVCLPTEYEPDHPNRYISGTQWHPDAEKDPRFRYPYKVDGDWRTEPGELLNPARLPQASVERLKRRPRGWRAKHQQHPLRLSGGQFQRAWFNTYHCQPEDIARTADEVFITVDAAKKGNPNSDFHSMQVWARKGINYYLLDRVCRRMPYPEFEPALDALHVKWAWCRSGTLIEDQANGTTYLQFRKGRRIGEDGSVALTALLDFQPTRDTPGKDKSKPARAIYLERAAEAGQIFLPSPSIDPEIAVWVEGWLLWVCAFPGGKHDDDVDAAAQLIMRWMLAAAKAKRSRGLRRFSSVLN